MIRRFLLAPLFGLVALPAVHAAGFPLKIAVTPATMPYGAYPAEEMIAYRVSTRVGSPRNDDVGLIAPVVGGSPYSRR